MAHSTLTAAAIDNNERLWTGWQNSIDSGTVKADELKVIGAGTLSVNTSKKGILILDGLTYDGSSAHISITPAATGEWSYFHFTLAGSRGKSAYYRLRKTTFHGDLEVNTTSCTVMGSDWKNPYSMRNASKDQYFWKDIPGDLTDDIQIIIKALVGDKYDDDYLPSKDC